MNITLKIKSFFSTVVTVVILAITILVMVVSVIIGGFYAAYNFILTQGITMPVASAITILFAVIILFFCTALIKKYIIRIHKPNGIEAIIEGFFNGLHLGGEPRI